MQVRVGEAGVAEAKAEWEDRVVPAAAESAAIEEERCRSVATRVGSGQILIEHRLVADIPRPGHRQATAWVDVAERDVGDGVATLRPREVGHAPCAGGA